MTKSKAHRKTKISANKSRKNMKRPVKQPMIVRFQDEPAEKVKVQIAEAPKIEGSKVEAQVVEEPKVEIPKVEEPKAKVEIDKEPVQVRTPKETAKAFDMVKVNKKMRERSQRGTQAQKQVSLTAKEIKEQEIKKAISATNRNFVQQKKHGRRYKKMDFGFRRVVLAMACATVAVAAIVYFVNVNSPDISLKVAAMQTGIDAHYPGYVPRDFALSDITSENGKIVLNFKNSSTGDAFSLTEEKVNWSNNDLYNNFIKSTYGDNYTLVSDNGFSLYVSGSNAAWLKDGIFYKITTTAGSLTKKQISTIAAKL